MPTLSSFPIIAREWRSRFRRDPAYILLSALIIAAAWAMIKRVNASVSDQDLMGGVKALAPLSQDLLVQMVWTQIVGVCVLAPGLSAPLIARERESGSSEHLLLAPLSPLRLVLEMWASGGLFLLLILFALWPLDLVALLLGNSSVSGLWGVALLVVGCVAWGSALGVACSAHARRAALALRGATGVTCLWLIFSLVCCVMAGEAPLLSRGGTWMPNYLIWFGRTNPVLCALDLLQPSPFLSPKWPFCLAFLAIGTPLFLFLAMLGVRKPLPDLPIITAKKGAHGGVSGALARLEMPLVGRFAPNNPVLAREARGKFRLRQPPLAVLISEIVLAIAVGVLYLALAREGWTNPTARPTIFWGVAWTCFVISVLAASTQGGSAFARERENGTWEALQLSLLSPAQIVRGKLVAALATMVFLSFPAWPLLFVCLQWDGLWRASRTFMGVQPFQLVAAVVIWLGTIWLQTLIAMLFSTRAKKVAGAIGASIMTALVWMLGSLFLFLISSGPSSEGTLGFLAVINPLMALGIATDPVPDNILWASTGWPFAIFAGVLGLILRALIEAEIQTLMLGDRATDQN